MPTDRQACIVCGFQVWHVDGDAVNGIDHIFKGTHIDGQIMICQYAEIEGQRE